VDEQKRAAFLKAYADEAAATSAELKALRAEGGKKVKDKDAAAKAYAYAKEALALAATNALAPSKAVRQQLESFLASDKLDAKLVKAAILTQATPHGLAEFAQQGQEQESLVVRLLADNALMKQMLMAGGANEGKYGRAMEIYDAIQRSARNPMRGFSSVWLWRLASNTLCRWLRKTRNPTRMPRPPLIRSSDICILKRRIWMANSIPRSNI
jgi:hypothetical protein